jgi:ABC-type nitrate/sulfonate/bicarbonate transport system substrate-binding protein
MRRLHRTAVKLGVVITASAILAACASSSNDKKGDASGDTSTKKTLNFAYSNAVQQPEKVPLHNALQNLSKDGIQAKELFNQNAEDAIQQVARGEADFGTGNASSVFAAIKKGVPIQAVMTAYLPAYLLVAPTSVNDPGGLDGLRVGIQSKISSTTLYTNLALSKYPNAKPKILVVPGSANRLQAMVAGQMDASVLQDGDWLTLEKKAPGKFHVIYNVTKENPKIIDSVIFAGTNTLKSDPAYVKKFLGAVQKEYAATVSDADKLATSMSTVVPDMKLETAKELAGNMVQDKIWPADGRFDDASLQATLDALKNSELLTADTLPTLKQCCTGEFLSK